MHMQSVNITIPDDAMYPQSTCGCPYWFPCWGNPCSTPVTQLLLLDNWKANVDRVLYVPSSLSSIFHRFSQLSTYSTCYLHLKLLIYKTRRIRSFDPIRKHNLCRKLGLVLIIIKSHNYTASQSEEKVSFCCQKFTNIVCLGVRKLRYRISARTQTYYAYTLLFQFKHSHLI